MTLRVPLSPLGTAKQRFFGLQRRGAGTPELPFPSELLGAAEVRDVGEELLHLSWEVARWAEGVEPADRRALMLLVLSALLVSREGSSYLPLDGTHWSSLLRDLGVSESELSGIERYVQRISAPRVIGTPGEVTPLLLVGSRLYPHRTYWAEQRLADSLRQRALQLLPDPAAVDGALEVVTSGPLKLTEDQTNAVRAAAEQRMLVISGGPGTGKTSIVVSILRLMVRLGVAVDRIALAAPTGKAAKRMEDAIKQSLAAIKDPSPEDAALTAFSPPKTLHRLLGYTPRTERFQRHEKYPLQSDLVIVDESSMIDLPLMDRLLRAVRPDAKLILLGDADQLPSVDVGAVLRDLVNAGATRVVRLTHSHRMRADDPAGRSILVAAGEVKEGRIHKLRDVITTRESMKDVTFDGVEHVDLLQATERRVFIERWYKERVRALPDLEGKLKQTYLVDRGVVLPDQKELIEPLLDHFERFRVLCLTRSNARPTGADSINEALHVERLKAFDEDDRASRASLLPGEPVIMERNDYGRDLFNGDYGVILRVAEKERKNDVQTVAAFRTRAGISVFPLDALRGDLSLAYAMTVHKAQGSEFERVALVLPDEDLPLLTREVVYTAITRSRRSVLIAGPRVFLSRAVDRRMERFSGLSDLLGGRS